MRIATALLIGAACSVTAAGAWARTRGGADLTAAAPRAAVMARSAPTPTKPASPRPARPADDVARDSARKPAEMIAFAGIRPGSKVGDLIPGAGYFTRIFSAAVGPKGTVYALIPAAYVKLHPEGMAALQTLAASPGYGNVRALALDPASPLPEPLDVVWTSQNYHDLHNAPAGTLEGFNRAVFAMLKPGGVFVVVDHAAEPGSGARDTNTLHRIDPAAVTAEVTAAGFVFEGESSALRNAADAHTAKVFDPSVRGRTDQFVYRFRKPLR